MNHSKKIRKLIADGKFKDAIKYSINLKIDKDKDLSNQIISLSGQFNEWKNNFNLGLSPNNSDKARIISALLDFADIIEENPEIISTDKEKVNKFSLSNTLKSLKTNEIPIQGILFVAILTIGFLLSVSSIGFNFLIYFIICLPLFTLALLLDSKIINLINSNNSFYNIAFTAIILFSLAISGYTLFKTLSPNTITSSSGLIDRELNKSRTNNILVKNDLLTTNLNTNFNVMTNYYFKYIIQLLSKNDDETRKRIISLHKERKRITQQIVDSKKENINKIFSDDNISNLLERLQVSILSHESANNMLDVILKIYNGKHYLHEIIDTSGLIEEYPFLDNFHYKHTLENGMYSDLEKDLIQTFGKEILFKKINSFDLNDIDKLRNTFDKIGILNQESKNISNQKMYDDFFDSFSSMLRDSSKLGATFIDFMNRYQDNVKIYICLIECNLIDFEKVILKLTPEYADRIMEDLLRERIVMFSVADAKLLVEYFNSHKSFSSSNNQQLIYILTNQIEKFEEKFGKDEYYRPFFDSRTLEEYFINLLRHIADDNNGGFRAVRELDFQKHYFEFLKIYNLIERNLIFEYSKS